ncbi:MAG: rRNA (uracil-5-)-methyltransferase RumA [Herbinix sp.]|jgi:23S rRNA (uracil1939-C5)-methyltransferase|nr:rRNA (uracil-5-)-methyltransferase RumA [Herbinix sp.]
MNKDMNNTKKKHRKGLGADKLNMREIREVIKEQSTASSGDFHKDRKNDTKGNYGNRSGANHRGAVQGGAVQRGDANKKSANEFRYDRDERISAKQSTITRTKRQDSDGKKSGNDYGTQRKAVMTTVRPKDHSYNRNEKDERKVNHPVSDEKQLHQQRSDYKDRSFARKENEGRSGNARAGQTRNRRAHTLAQSNCPKINKCGGCRMLNSDYQEHLNEKQKTVDKLIKKYCKVESIIGMEKPYYYRNKVHAVFDHDKKGNPISGIYEEGTHHVIPIDSCRIEDQKADAIIVSIRGLLKSFKIKTYDEDSGYGLIRHVLVRKGFTSGEIMVVLVLASPILPSKNNFVKALRQLHPEITTIIVNVNDKQTSMVLGEKEQVIYGKGYIEDSLCGKVFRISAKSFYQVNPVQTELLYQKAIELAGLHGSETVIDAYCGIGTIGLIASDYVKKVIGVELNKDAVKDAEINAKRNQVTNIEFYKNDAGDFMGGMAAQKEIVDIVFMDPPRAGSDEKFLGALVQLKPNKIVYISCNPVTLERDLAFLTKKGYKAEIAIPVDMFPWTEHVETVVLMSRNDK